MCPACITTAAIVAASAGSSGGLVAWVARVWHRRARIVRADHGVRADRAATPDHPQPCTPDEEMSS